MILNVKILHYKLAISFRRVKLIELLQTQRRCSIDGDGANFGNELKKWIVMHIRLLVLECQKLDIQYIFLFNERIPRGSDNKGIHITTAWI